MTRAAKRDVDRGALGQNWERQAASLGFDARGIAAEAMSNEAGRDGSPEAKRDAGERIAALEAVGADKATERETSLDQDRSASREHDTSAPREWDEAPGMEQDRAAKSVDRGLGL